jgi:uncharacterized protein (TIGR02996 family)/excisionase family DNA binding protein
MTSATETALLQAIVERSTDDLPRRVYADWLDDHGQPERAEFIRLQLALARAESSETRQREQELLAGHGAAWLEAALPGWRLRRSAGWLTAAEKRGKEQMAAFRRGMVEAIFLTLQDFLDQARWLGRHLRTLRRVQLTDREPLLVRADWYGWSNHESVAGASYHLPWQLHQCLPPDTAGSHWSHGYRSEAEALAGLSRGCVRYAWIMGQGGMRMVFTTGEVAKICRVAPVTVTRWFDSGRLRGYRIPGSQDRRIPRENLIRFLRENGLSLDWTRAEWEDEDLAAGFGRVEKDNDPVRS